MGIIEKLHDLIKQATVERSHYYVKSVAEEAIMTICDLEREILMLKNDRDRWRQRADNNDSDRCMGYGVIGG